MITWIWLLLCAAPLSAQQHRLTFRPVAAEYSNALDRIIMVSANPNVLHVYDPATRLDQTIALNSLPLSFSMSLDGNFAAIGHNGSIAYVNLQTRAIQKTFTVPFSTGLLVLAADSIFAIQSTGPLQIIDLATGTVTAGPAFNPAVAKLHPSGTAIYGEGGNRPYKYVISTRETTASRENTGQWSTWMAYSQDGARIVGPAVIRRASTDPLLDMAPMAPFPGIAIATDAAESAATNRLALIPDPSVESLQLTDEQVVLYESITLREIGRLWLPKFPDGTTNTTAHGRRVFFNASGSALFVLTQAAIDFAVQRFDLANPAACQASFSQPAVDVPATGAVIEAAVSAAPECVHRAAPGQLPVDHSVQGTGPFAFT